jgi:hypothetical protein
MKLLDKLTKWGGKNNGENTENWRDDLCCLC